MSETGGWLTSSPGNVLSSIKIGEAGMSTRNTFERGSGLPIGFCDMSANRALLAGRHWVNLNCRRPRPLHLGEKCIA